jgi:hypothetical protein
MNSLEVNIGIVICCLPALRQLYNRIKQKRQGYSNSSQRDNSGPSDRKRTKSATPRDPLDSIKFQCDSTPPRSPHDGEADPDELYHELRDVEKMSQ